MRHRDGLPPAAEGGVAMSMASNTVAGILNATFYDVTEEYASLLKDWYGDDLSSIDCDDEDLADAVWELTRSINYWRTDPDRMTPYEKLRAKYEALMETHQSLLDERRKLVSTIRQQQEDRHGWAGTGRRYGT
jgi:hypothetical protein